MTADLGMYAREQDEVSHGAVHASRRQRVAFVGPMPPSEYGVPVYCGETVKALSVYYDVDVIATTQVDEGVARYAKRVLDATCIDRLDQYHGALFVFGNHPQHFDALRLSLSYDGGVGIFHDAQQLDFARYAIGADSVKRVIGEYISDDVDDRDLELWHRKRHRLPHPVLDPCAQAISCAIVHSPTQLEHFRKYYKTPARYIPVAIQHSFTEREISSDCRMRAKLRCGVHERRIAVGSFGFVHDQKLSSLVVSAMRHLHDRGCNVHYYLVGDASAESSGAVVEYAKQLGVDGFLHFTGRLSEEQYLDWLLAVDVAVQLRRPMFGQLSGGLLDCVAAGGSVITTESLAESIEARGFTRIVKDSCSSLDVADEVYGELTSQARPERGGTMWQRYVEQHSFAEYARQLHELIQRQGRY